MWRVGRRPAAVQLHRPASARQLQPVCIGNFGACKIGALQVEDALLAILAYADQLGDGREAGRTVEVTHSS